MRLILLTLSLIVFAMQSFAMQITCEHKIGEEMFFFMEGEITIENNDVISKTVYSIADDVKITVLESSTDIEEDQRLIDQLNWKKFGDGFLGTGFVELDGIQGAGSHYIDENQEIGTAIFHVEGMPVLGSVFYDCNRTG